MTTEHQKNLETFYAEKASDLLGKSWKVRPSPGEVGWPDLLVTTEKGEFGLEVREIYLDETQRGSIKKATENNNLKIIQKLADAYYKSNLHPIKVSLLGDITNHDQILCTITNEVSQLSELGQKRIEPYSGCLIYIQRFPDQLGEFKGWDYVSDRVGGVCNVNKEVINRAIALKAKKLSKYTKNISDIRLLLVSDRILNSGKAQLADDITFNKHGFTIVYYLSYPVSVRELSS